MLAGLCLQVRLASPQDRDGLPTVANPARLIGSRQPSEQAFTDDLTAGLPGQAVIQVGDDVDLDIRRLAQGGGVSGPK